MRRGKTNRTEFSKISFLPERAPIRGGLRISCKTSQISLYKTQAVRYLCSVNRKEISKIASMLGKLGGSVKSKSKAAAARKNGKLGGRPRKAKP